MLNRDVETYSGDEIRHKLKECAQWVSIFKKELKKRKGNGNTHKWGFSTYDGWRTFDHYGDAIDTIVQIWVNEKLSIVGDKYDAAQEAARLVHKVYV